MKNFPLAKALPTPSVGLMMKTINEADDGTYWRDMLKTRSKSIERDEQKRYQCQCMLMLLQSTGTRCTTKTFFSALEGNTFGSINQASLPGPSNLFHCCFCVAIFAAPVLLLLLPPIIALDVDGVNNASGSFSSEDRSNQASIRTGSPTLARFTLLNHCCHY